MKTDYASHEERYRQLRADGASGWDAPDQRADHVDELTFYDDRPEVPRAGRLLELGCGAGDIALLYAARGYAVSGVDVSPTAVAWGSEKAASAGLELDLRVGDVRALPHEDERFDVVLDGHCLHCIIGDDRARVLAEARRVLRPGGALLVGTMCGEVTSPAILARYDARARCMLRGDVATRYFGDPDAILEELREARFTVAASRVKPRASRDDQDMLLVVATR